VTSSKFTRGKNLEEARVVVFEDRSVTVADTAQKLNISQG
jgi:hypothetical protein